MTDLKIRIQKLYQNVKCSNLQWKRVKQNAKTSIKNQKF